MKGMFSQCVLFFFLILLMWTGISYVAQNMQYGGARDFYRAVLRQMEESDFDEKILDDCRKKAEQRGYQLQIKQYGENRRDARVTLVYDYVFPVTQQKKQYQLDGYVR